MIINITKYVMVMLSAAITVAVVNTLEGASVDELIAGNNAGDDDGLNNSFVLDTETESVIVGSINDVIDGFVEYTENTSVGRIVRVLEEAVGDVAGPLVG